MVPNQKEKFESDDLMKKHTREGEASVVLMRTVARIFLREK